MMGKAKKKFLPTETELFVYLREDIQKLSKAVQDFVTQVNSNHDVFHKPSDDEYDVDLSVESLSIEYSDDKEEVENFSEQIGDPVFDVYDEHDALCGYPIFEDEIENKECSFIDQFGDGVFDAKKPPVFDVDDKEDETEFFLEHIIDPSCEDLIKANKDSFINLISDPAFAVFDKDDGELLAVEREINAGVIYDDPIYDEDTPMPLEQIDFNEPICFHNDFGESNGVTKSFDLKDTTIPFQTMSPTTGQSPIFLVISSMSMKKEEYIEQPKSERGLVFKEKVDYMSVDGMKQHVDYNGWRKNCHRQVIREPPHRAQNTPRAYVNHVIRHNLFVPGTSGSEYSQEDTELLETKFHSLIFKQDQREDVSLMSLSAKLELDNRIAELQKALVCEKEKRMNLERELNETYKKIRMLNKGTATLDKILRMGRTEKTTMGLGYQGSTSSSHTVFVRSNSVEPDKKTVVSKDAKNQNKETAIVSRVLICYGKGCASPRQYHVDPRWIRGFMFDSLVHNSEMIRKEYVNVKRTHSGAIGNKHVQCELLLEHGVKKKLNASMGIVSGEREDGSSHDTCDTKLLNIQWQDVKKVIQDGRCNNYKVDRKILVICFREIPPMITFVQRQEIQNSEKVDGDICLTMRSVLSRYLLTTSYSGVRHSTLAVHVSQIIKFVVMTSWDVGDSIILHIFYSTSLFGSCARISRLLHNPLQLFLMDLESYVLLPLTILYELQWHILLWSEKLDEEDTEVGEKINLLWNCTSNFMYDFTCGDKEDRGRNVLSCVLFLILGFERVVVTPNSTYEKILSFWNQEILLKSLRSVFLVDLDSSVFPPPSITCFSTAAWLITEEVSVWRCARHIYMLESFYQWVRPPSCLCELVLIGVIDLSDDILTNGARNGELKFCDRIHFFVVFLRDKSVLFSVTQGVKVDFWVGVHNLYSTRRRIFLQGTSYVNCWSDVTSNSSKPLCVILSEYVISFHGYISLHSRKGAFVGVQSYSHNMLDGGELRMRIQHLHEFYNITWLAIDLFTYHRIRYTNHYWQLNEKRENMESSEEKAGETRRILFFEVREQKFPFRFEVESFKPGGT